MGPGRTDAFYASQLEGEWGNGRITPCILNLGSGWRQSFGVEAEFWIHGRKRCILIAVILIEEATHACLGAIVTANFLNKSYASCLTFRTFYGFLLSKIMTTYNFQTKGEEENSSDPTNKSSSVGTTSNIAMCSVFTLVLLRGI